jgi:hypothetical protein
MKTKGNKISHTKNGEASTANHNPRILYLNLTQTQLDFLESSNEKLHDEFLPQASKARTKPTDFFSFPRSANVRQFQVGEIIANISSFGTDPGAKYFPITKLLKKFPRRSLLNGKS